MMRIGSQLDGSHECRGCWTLFEGDSSADFEEIVAHEDPASRFVTIATARGDEERYSPDDPMARVYLETRGPRMEVATLTSPRSVREKSAESSIHRSRAHSSPIADPRNSADLDAGPSDATALKQFVNYR